MTLRACGEDPWSLLIENDFEATRSSLPSAPTVFMASGPYAPGQKVSYFLRIASLPSGGKLWGTVAYTHDSLLSAAAVHSGFFTVGEEGVVEVENLGPKDSFEASLQNGVQSLSYDTWGESFRFVRSIVRRIPDATASVEIPVIRAPATMRENRGKLEAVYSYFVTPGENEGKVWGTDIYSDDSSITSAALHAGVIKRGESGHVMIIVLAGLPAYEGTTRNGIQSFPYGTWHGSFRFIGHATLRADHSVFEDLDSIPDVVPKAPPNLSFYRGQNGRRILYRVRGAHTGKVWGTDLYTDDSSVCSAAVHSGFVKFGQLSVVEVEILPGRDSFEGCSRHGVESSPYGQWGGSFRFVAAREMEKDDLDEGADLISPPERLSEFRSEVGEDKMFTILGIEHRGTVWGGGDGVYTDDSDVAVAAVHAGYVAPGETKRVRVRILGPMESFIGSTQNGVTTLPYGRWSGSFQFVPLK